MGTKTAGVLNSSTRPVTTITTRRTPEGKKSSSIPLAGALCASSLSAKASRSATEVIDLSSSPIPARNSHTTQVPNLNAWRIFNRCEEARGNLGSNVPTTLKLAQVALQVVQRIKGEGFDENKDYAEYFFSAFHSSVVQKRDLDLIYDLAGEMLKDLVRDDDLTFKELQKLEGWI